MAHSVFSSGPLEIFVSVRAIAGISPSQVRTNFLGICQQPVEPAIQFGAFQVRTDLAGTVFPYDHGWAGGQAMHQIDLVDYDPDILATLETGVPINGKGGFVGWDDVDMGTLYSVEGYRFTIYYRAMRRNVTAMKNAGMPPGRRYPGCRMVTSVRGQGNQSNHHFIAVESVALRTSARSGIGQSQWILCDDDISVVANLQGI